MRLASPKSVRPSGGLEVPAGLDCCLESEGSLEAEFLPFGRGGGEVGGGVCGGGLGWGGGGVCVCVGVGGGGGGGGEGPSVFFLIASN